MKKILDSNQHKTKYFCGLEVGAVSVKYVQRTQEGKIKSEIKRHGGNPNKIIQNILNNYSDGSISKMVVTGETAKGLLNFPYYSEVECLEKALSYLKIKPDILLSLGGETFTIYPMKDGRIKNVISTSRCQAGTGEFLVQQFQRMGFSLKEGIEASSTGNLVSLATRCSVHCKSDATHKLNKGECTPNDIAKTLIYDLARKVKNMIELAQWSNNLIVLTGNVANNNVFVQNLRDLLNESEIVIIQESPYLESFGASLLALELPDSAITYPIKDQFKYSKKKFDTLPSLKLAENLLDYRVKAESELKIIDGETYILGVDVGSTTTKIVLFNISDGSIGASVYLKTLGNPIQATKQCLHKLIKQIGNKKIEIIQSGVTGSAREVVSVYLDNCLTFNEILAHARSSIEEVPDVDTVFEIGGQDSKFISFLGGIPIDYSMNEGCSAGTGSFLEESASNDMGIEVTEISTIAENSANPIAFGERCAAFINTDLRAALQQGAKKEDVVAGLVYSIADNYISRIVGSQQVGENLLFLGGLALNRSVALAIASRSQRKIVVPAHPELMGAWGAALMARDMLKDNSVSRGNYNLTALVQGEMGLKRIFKCSACENTCDINEISIREKTYLFGGLCSKYWLQRHKNLKNKEFRKGMDFIAVRNKLMFEDFGPQHLNKPRGTIGLPMGLLSYELFPFFVKLINELGYNIVISEYSAAGNIKEHVKAPICYPCELVHVSVNNLREKNVDFIFLPYVLELAYSNGYIHGYTCPSTTVIPDVIRSAFEDIKNKILSPHINLSKTHTKATLKEIERMASVLGCNKNLARKAGAAALAHYNKFKDKYMEIGKLELKELIKEPTVVIAGRPYIACSSDVNFALSRKITSRGYHVIPMDILPNIDSESVHQRNAWGFTQQINNAVSHVKENPNLYICFISCFSCQIDATMYHHFRQQLEGETFCYLEIDSHTAHAGLETRVGAFLDIIEERRRKAGKTIKKTIL